jgi:hypothetical protein
MAALAALLALAGCGGAPEDGAGAEEADEAGVLLESARRPLERAGEVEDIAAGRKEALDAGLEAAEGAD